MDTEKVKEKYRGFSSEELVEIVQNIDDEYEAAAVELATSELKERGITDIPEVEKAPPLQPKQEFDLARSAVIRVYSDELSADMARAKLEAENIPAFVWKDDCGGWRPWWQPITGVRLVVREDNAEEAEQILRQFESEPGEVQ